VSVSGDAAQILPLSRPVYDLRTGGKQKGCALLHHAWTCAGRVPEVSRRAKRRVEHLELDCTVSCLRAPGRHTPVSTRNTLHLGFTELKRVGSKLRDGRDWRMVLRTNARFSCWIAYSMWRLEGDETLCRSAMQGGIFVQCVDGVNMRAHGDVTCLGPRPRFWTARRPI
jgi:hypothetical protein